MKKLYGVVHLAPLPGSPGNDRDLATIEAAALADARCYREAGWHGLVVENYGDIPFVPGAVGPETVAAMTRVARGIRLQNPDLQLGINVLRNDGEAAVAIAAAVGADFIRVNVLSGVSHTDQGVIQGRAAWILKLRRALGCKVQIFADVDVKHAVMAAHLDPLHQAEDLVERAGAEALIVSGRATGERADRDLLERVAGRFDQLPVLVGSGLTPENLQEMFSVADGAIVGTAVKVDRITGNPVDPVAAKDLAGLVAGL